MIYELTERIEVLESELARVKAEKDHKDTNHPQTKTPVFVKTNKKPKKKTARKKRDAAYVRKKETPPEQIFHTAERIQKQREFEQRLKTICMPYVKKDTPMSTLAARAITFLPELFVFIRFPNIKSDNNPAERIIRHTVVARKISGGTKTPKGSETKAILTSLFDTWQLQNLNPLQQCRLILTS